MSFVKDMLREFGFAFCISEILPMFFKSYVAVSVGSSYVKFVAETSTQDLKNIGKISDTKKVNPKKTTTEK